MSKLQGTSSKVRLSRLKIEKFRAIGSADIEFGEMVALVGQNGAGKSSVLRALNAFFNFERERGDFEARRHDFTKTSQSVIEVTLTGLFGADLPTVEQGGDEVRARLKFRRQEKWECWSEGRWQAMPQGFHEALRKHFTFALVPVRRDHQVAHDPAGGLLERAVEEWVTNHSQRDRRSPQIAQVASTLQKRSLAGLERQLQKIAPFSGPFRFELKYTTPPDYRLLLQNLALTVCEGGQSIPLSDSGSGTQSMAVFALYAYLAELESTTYLLGFEEPEQNLHPQAQQQLMRNLARLGLQVVFTTHSPTIVDLLDHDDVVLCRRVPGKSRDLEIQISQIRDDFFAERGLDREKYYKFHRRRNSDFLFADYVVVTESPIDALVVEQVMSDAGVEPGENGISFVALDGVEAIPYMYHLLKQLGIGAAYVVDKDYFLPYRTANRRKDSLDSRGYPQYSEVPKSRTLLDDLFPKRAARDAVVRQLHSNHTEAMRTLKEVGFFCFRFAIEIDLVAAAAPRERLYDHFRISLQDRTESALLVDRAGALKSQEALLKAIAGLDSRQLPVSFKCIRRELPRLAGATRVAERR
ncbi:ATP-dependent nuclease [Cellulomonas soli]|uniref:ATP-dependent nuclease n=1 Tax=Cellulomonas soli TaxID=931535 RepID=UPI0015CB7D38|nr:ATP-binding protein [Cellulomonas soli]NYI57455.1 energy-coupling factor transporter ATP-binding protein EcfA2 [Cellulomonas soli]